MRACGNCGGAGHNRRTCPNTPTVESPSFEPNESVEHDQYRNAAAKLLRVLDKYMMLKITSPSQYENYLKDTAKFLVDFKEKFA